VVGRVLTAEATEAHLAKLMVGRETFGVTRSSTEAASNTRESVLSIREVWAASVKGHDALRGISLDVHAGEIVAVAGVAGNGQSELAHVLQGLRKPTRGAITLKSRSLLGLSPGEIARRGVGHIPEDRLAAVVGELTVAENMVLEYLPEFTRRGQLDRTAIHAHAAQLIEEYQIKATPTDRARTLSGGNVQKVILARSLHRDPALVVAVDPTRGLDIGATDYVRSRLLDQRARGAAVLLISEDLDEILALADRIVVIYEGQIVGEVIAQEADAEKLGLMMSGSKLER
jgi:simple sugar transport system ATP-binding protein